MTSWTVLWRGLRYRAGRSLLVLLMATVATTAAALVPSYLRGAQESVARDALDQGTVQETALVVQLPTTRNEEKPQSGEAAQPDLAAGAARTDAVLAESELLSGLVEGKAAHAETNLRLAGRPIGFIYSGHLVYRADACGHVTVSGRCPTAADEVMVSARVADYLKIAVGDRLPIALGRLGDENRTSKGGGLTVRSLPASTSPTVVGVYTPTDPVNPYWSATPSMLAFSPIGDVHQHNTYWNLDAVFAGAAGDVEAFPGAGVRRAVSYWLDLSDVGTAEAARLDAEIRSATRTFSDEKMSLRSGLPSLVAEIRKDQDAIGTSVPVGAVPLLVLAFAVLMVLVAALTEERGPEIALARLHGYANQRVGAFGLGEVLLLITLAAPLGLLLSRIVLAVIASLWLAPGTSLAFTWQPVAAVGIAVLVAYASAALASRRVFSTRIVTLLRRVPQRTTWRASALEGAAVALAVAVLAAAWQDRSSSLAVLTAPLLAIVAGIVGGRLLAVVAGVRLKRARRQADTTGMLSAAALARRSGRQRIIVVVAVATALMGFSATTWDVAAQARAEAANSAVGAATVYKVAAPDAQRLLAGVTAAVPDGSAMAVVRRPQYYDGDVIQVMGVQSDRLAKSATWFRHGETQLADVGRMLRPAAPAAAAVGGRLTVQLQVDGFAGAPVALAAEVLTAGQTRQSIDLGRLKSGSHEYIAEVPEGTLAMLKLLRTDVGGESGSGTVTVLKISSARGEAPIGGKDAWQAVVPAGTTVDLMGDSQLTARISAGPGADVRLARLRAPKALPVLLTGTVPAQEIDADGAWPFIAFGNQPQQFTAARTDALVPGAAGHGMLVDLDYGLTGTADILASPAPEGDVFYEVWAGPDAPADLARRLSEQGIQIRSSQSLTGFTDRLGRAAPALALRLYALGGVVAVLLALGIVLLAVRVGAEQRRYGLAALLVAGVPERALRSGVRREFLTLLGWPSAVGFAVGVVSAVLMLPAIPLVATGVVTEARWQPAPGALAGVAAACLACLLLALPVAVRLVRQATPDLLRGES